ncbi:MAG: agmatinase [Gammaproteobacteria bacterium]
MTQKPFNAPLGANEMPRFGGPTTMMRLPPQNTAADLDVCFTGIPMDIGTSNRSGTRFGPRQIRQESTLLRPYNAATGAAPFSRLQVADIGDVPVNPYNLAETVRVIEEFYRRNIFAHAAVPLTLGGDHTLTLPVLRAVAEKHGAVALLHIDAHADVSDRMFGEAVAHGTVFRRAAEEGLLKNDKVWQIGLRGGGYTANDWDWGRQQGFTVIPAADCWRRDMTALMADIRAQLGGMPAYLTFDIDSLDPAFAPGTGTPEIAGLTPWQALEIIRGCAGLNLVGCDLVEVSPPYDFCGNTALVGANLLFEMLCVLP